METTDVVAQAYASEELKFGLEYLIPKPFDPRLIEEVPLAVVRAAMASGVATRPIKYLDDYRRTLHGYVIQAGLFMQPVIEVTKKAPARIVYDEGENEDVLMEVQAVVDEQIARPILSGRPNRIEQSIDRMGLIRSLLDALMIGPMLNGLCKPAHVVISSVTSRGIFNMTAVMAADIHCRSAEEA